MPGNNSAPYPRITKVPDVWTRTSVLVAILVIITSICGIFVPATYAREAPLWAIQAVGQDIANLLVAGMLLCCTFLVARQSLRGFLVWLGLLMYLIYAFAIYAFAVHFQFLFLAYVIILGLAGYTLAGGLFAADRESVSRLLQKIPAVRHAAILLAIIAVLFIVLWLVAILPDLLTNTFPAKVEEIHLLVNPVHVLDLAFLLPGMLATAYLIRREKPVGILMAVPMLVFSITMGMGIVAMNILSAAAGLPYTLPGTIMVSLIIVLSAAVTYQILTAAGKK
ncbi:MAG: hypothetical protein GYA23_13205 [Methanomicrobiales archaeon]|nr:hypothetical protein [Methanomicrobiales archaeon]